MTPSRRPRPGRPLRPGFAGWRLGLAAALVLVAPIVAVFLLLTEFGVIGDADPADGPSAVSEAVDDDAEPTLVIDDGSLPIAEDLSLQTAEPQLDEADAADEPEQQTYIVVPGDTLAAIARRFEVDTFALAAFNEIEDINRLSVGQRLEIPQPDYVVPDPLDEDEAEDDGTPDAGPAPVPPGTAGATNQ